MADRPIIVNVNVGSGGTAMPVKVQRRTGWLVQLLYFVLIGWWLGALAVCLAYALFALVVTIPLGISIVNRIPYLIALREPPALLTPWGAVTVQQRNFLLRAIWFFLIGLEVTAVWMSVAYLLSLTIIGMPIGFWMFDRAPALLTLRRSG